MGVLNDLDLENVPEESAVPEGEYELRIVDAKDHVSKTSGKPSINVVFVIDSEPNSQLIYHYMSLPTPDDDDRSSNSKKRRIKDFLTVFGLSPQSEYEEWIGLTGWALVEVDDRTEEPRNAIRRFIVAR